MRLCSLVLAASLLLTGCTTRSISSDVHACQLVVGGVTNYVWLNKSRIISEEASRKYGNAEENWKSRYGNDAIFK